MKMKFFSRTVQPRSFNYIPMYYDEQKEYIDTKKQQYRELDEKERTIEERKAILRQEFSASRSRTEHASQARRSANIRTLILVGIILALGYFLLYGLDDIDVIVEKMWK